MASLSCEPVKAVIHEACDTVALHNCSSSEMIKCPWIRRWFSFFWFAAYNTRRGEVTQPTFVNRGGGGIVFTDRCNNLHLATVVRGACSQRKFVTVCFPPAAVPLQYLWLTSVASLAWYYVKATRGAYPAMENNAKRRHESDDKENESCSSDDVNRCNSSSCSWFLPLIFTQRRTTVTSSSNS